MATLYVENVPDDLYEALRKRAKSQHRSIAAEVLWLLKMNIPTEKEFKAREEAYQRLMNFRFKRIGTGDLPDSTEMIREDRER